MKESYLVKEKLLSGECDSRIAEIYSIPDREERERKRQRERLIAAVERYEELFGEDTVEIYSAPGRTEIGGNHTDHQCGMVLAASIHLDTVAVVGACRQNLVELVSEGYDPVIMELESTEPDSGEYGTTAALIRGVAAGMRRRGYRVGGFRAYMTSNVRNGAGLSSSAAFETVVGTIFSGLYNGDSVSSAEIAMIGQYAENVYFGKPCGLMDQMACSVGGIVHIDFADPAVPEIKKIPFDLEKAQYELCIVDTKGSHADLTEDYAKIPVEMKAAAEFFGKKVLRQVSEQEFRERIGEIRLAAGDRCVLRALHFFAEERRVEQEVCALQTGDFPAFLCLVRASGDSSFKYLQNIYSNREEQNQPISVGLALSEHILGEEGASRVHGGGFAGTIQSFVKTKAVPNYREEMEKIFGRDAFHVLRIRKYGGVRIL